MKRIRSFLVILCLSFFGEVLRDWIPLPVPAGIYGLALLLLALFTGAVPLPAVEGGADFLVEHMPLFFIPAGVGLMTKWGDLQTMLVPFLLAVVVITVLVMAASGGVAQALIRRGKKRERKNA